MELSGEGGEERGVEWGREEGREDNLTGEGR